MDLTSRLRSSRAASSFTESVIREMTRLAQVHDAINLGCCGGARTSTASVAMVGEVAKSDVPMLGYTVPYAVSNTLLTLWGLIIVLMVS